MHVLGQYGRENAAALFDLFMECMPEYPIDKPDQNGNTGITTHITSTEGTQVVSNGAITLLDTWTDKRLTQTQNPMEISVGVCMQPIFYLVCMGFNVG